MSNFKLDKENTELWLVEITKPLKITNEQNIIGTFCLELKHCCFQLVVRDKTEPIILH